MGNTSRSRHRFATITHRLTLNTRKVLIAFRWLPSYIWQQAVARRPCEPPLRLIIALADHFEPYIMPGHPGASAGFDIQMARVTQWIQKYEMLFDKYRDSSGIPFRHTYFYPGEQYDAYIVQNIGDHCARGWGEVEVHLHHGIDAPDTAENLRALLLRFLDKLTRHGCLSQMDGIGGPRYAFVHGNFTLANSGDGMCGVDSELEILRQTGCYADFTLPSWPNPAQTGKTNSLYECTGRLDRRGAHRLGRALKVGHAPLTYPLMVQGPLTLNFSKRYLGVLPAVDNGALTVINPPSAQRLKLWTSARICVVGRPNWLFIKLHCHGMDPHDTPALLGKPMTDFLTDLRQMEEARSVTTCFVTAREMTNIILAACDGRIGMPQDFRDYRLRRFITTHSAASNRMEEINR